MAGNTAAVLRRPAVPPPIRIRRSVLSLPPNDPILVFYGKAVAEMRKKPFNDPTGWRYQAAIHEYRRDQDPFASPSDTFPADAGTFWAQCEHQGWFFLPWHRMYLHHFEMIVLSEVINLGGPTDWALPYWNYSANDPRAKLLPEAFRPGSATGLSFPVRDPDAQAGRPFMRGDPTNINCLTEAQFTGGIGNGFGGLQPQDPQPPFGPQNRRNHAGGPGEGRVESLPHDAIHQALNGPNDSTNAPLQNRGFMGDFTRAPLDPIFWVHHCNIDRLWEVWVHTAGHSNPTTSDWLTAVSWSFHDATSAVKVMTVSDVLDTRATPLAYEYDDVSNPFSP